MQGLKMIKTGNSLVQQRQSWKILVRRLMQQQVTVNIMTKEFKRESQYSEEMPL